MSRARSSAERFLGACRDAGLNLGPIDEFVLAPAALLDVPADRWQTAAGVAKANGWRWSALWATETGDGFVVSCLVQADGGHLVLRTATPRDRPLASHAALYPAADRPERHARDLLGVRFEPPADARRWTRHQAWPEGHYPLGVRQPTLPEGIGETGTDHNYPFLKAKGSGVVEIPVGPVHAGIIEPGHFRFLAVGETVLNLEQRLGYVHKGIEKIAVGRDPVGLARLAGRVSGDTTVAHAWAACQALERAVGVAVPARALALRAVLTERERVANHLGDIGAICNDVGFGFAYYQLTRLREEFVRDSAAAFGHRLMMDAVVPGGVAVDLAAAAAAAMVGRVRALAAEVAQVIAIIEGSESLEERLMTTGRLAPEEAAALGVVGFVGKASGCPFDARLDAPYPPYDTLDFPRSSYRAGDVAARAKVRADEIGSSLALIARLLETLPDGTIRAEWPQGDHAGEGLGIIEGWRGEIVSYVALDRDGRVSRFFPRDPSWLTWPALERLIMDNIVPDFPVCNKSVNGSYSGQDL